MPLNPALKKLIDAKLANTTKPQWQLPIEQVRQNVEALWQPALTGTVEDVADIIDEVVITDDAEVPIRIYIPDLMRELSVLMYFHGGGFVKGSVAAADPFCRKLANLTQCTVFSVDYRLAPEMPFPAAVKDVMAATQWAYDHAEEYACFKDQLFISGESAGGNLAAVVALLNRDKFNQLPIVGQILLQPVIDFTLSHESINMSEQESLVIKSDLEWYYKTYYPNNSHLKNPLISPIFADSLADLPPTLIIAAEYDSLRDEAKAYAEALRTAGVDVDYHCYLGMVHGFLQLGGLVSDAEQAIEEINRFIGSIAIN